MKVRNPRNPHIWIICEHNDTTFYDYCKDQINAMVIILRNKTLCHNESHVHLLFVQCEGIRECEIQMLGILRQVLYFLRIYWRCSLHCCNHYWNNTRYCNYYFNRGHYFNSGCDVAIWLVEGIFSVINALVTLKTSTFHNLIINQYEYNK